jgi:hypothetical protein
MIFCTPPESTYFCDRIVVKVEYADKENKNYGIHPIYAKTKFVLLAVLVIVILRRYRHLQN